MHLLQRDPEDYYGATPIPTTASIHSSVFLDMKRGSVEAMEGNWKLMTAQTVYSHGQCIRPPLRDPWTLTHVITRVYTQESESLVAIQNILGRSHICRVWMPTEDACCASQTQRDEFIMVGGNDTELKFSGFDSESYNSFGWLFLKDNRKMQVISVFAKGTVQWSGWDFTHLQKQGPRAEL